MGVNDLSRRWRRNPGRNEERDDCADELGDAAREAWHPISNPPTEGDANREGHVAVIRWDPNWGDYRLQTWAWSAVAPYCWPDAMWARIRDVVLLPPKEEK